MVINSKKNDFDYKSRQQRIFEVMPVSSVMILESNPIAYRSNDTEYAYRASSNILYITGFAEPESILVLMKVLQEDQTVKEEILLFVQPKDPEKETWMGRRSGPEKTKELFPVDDAFNNTEFEKWFGELSDKIITYYFDVSTKLTKVFDLVISYLAKGHMKTLLNPNAILRNLRTIKDDNELELLKKSSEIAAEAHVETMKYLKPGVFEYEIDNILQAYVKSQGASGVAYNSICASGDNATILHYVTNSDECKDGDLFLIDAGCEYQYYASDITRTFPVNGKFSETQRKVYEIVLMALKDSTELCKVGNNWNQVNEATIKTLTDGLVSLGILEGNIDELIKEKKYKPFFMHSFGHSIGLDTHDLSNFRSIDDKGNEIYPEFKPGTVLTVEPGLYFSSTLENIPEEYKGIGVRIEDDVLITDNGPIVLTEKVPKEIDEIEKLMASKY